MTDRKPPRIAMWLLERLGFTRRNPTLVGDLIEEFNSGRSRAWYWRQAVRAIASGFWQNLSLVNLSVFALMFILDLVCDYLCDYLFRRFGDQAHIIMSAAGWLGFLVLAGFFVMARANAAKPRRPITGKTAQRSLLVYIFIAGELLNCSTFSQGSSLEMWIFEDFKLLAAVFLLVSLSAPLSKPGAVK